MATMTDNQAVAIIAGIIYAGRGGRDQVTQQELDRLATTAWQIYTAAGSNRPGL
jgi:hypothetical protein